MTSFPSPDTRHIPSPRVEFEACIHISETLFYLWYYSETEAGGSRLFEATGPEGPEQWGQHFRIKWRTADTLEVAYDQTIQVADATDHYRGLHIVFSRF